MRRISWLGASHLICSHLLNRIFQGLYVPFRGRLKYKRTWWPICSTSPVVAERRAGIWEQNRRELPLLMKARSLLPVLYSIRRHHQGPGTVPKQQEKVLTRPVTHSEKSESRKTHHCFPFHTHRGTAQPLYPASRADSSRRLLPCSPGWPPAAKSLRG